MYGVFSYIYHKNQPNVGIDIPYTWILWVLVSGYIRVHPTFVKFQSLIHLPPFIADFSACHVVLLLLVEDPEFESEGWEAFDYVFKMDMFCL